MLMSAARSHLLVVDVQERLVPAVADAEGVVRRIALLIAGAARLGVPVTVLEQYPEGLGATVAPLREALPPEARVLPKITFSGLGDPAVAAHVTADPERRQIVVAGLEAHVCVLQTALHLKERGLDVFVVGDAVSSRDPANVRAAHARLLHTGCAWVTTEMVVFEWMERAGTADFKALVPLIK